MSHSGAYTPVGETDIQVLQQAQEASSGNGSDSSAMGLTAWLLLQQQQQDDSSASVLVLQRGQTKKREVFSVRNIVIVCGILSIVLILMSCYTSCRRRKLAAMETYLATPAHTQMAQRS